ncbi:MAG: hypothetical protein HKN59_06310 [Gammaproteobacteria bacterium]|nr:hypothetical protein [Gammaproteobacteria bacterium]
MRTAKLRRGIEGLLVGVLVSASGAAAAEFSANAGWVSEYIFRGVPQKTSSASAGVDFEEGGFYIGTWGADVGDGLEIDGYLGYTFEVEDFNFGIGGTGYYYTGDFDDTYQEINLSFGFAKLSVDVAIGQYENFAGPTQDYTFTSATLEHNGFHGTVGNFSQDFDGTYVDVGYGFSVAEEVDVSVSWIYSDKDLAFNAGEEDNTLVFGLSKSFSLSD